MQDSLLQESVRDMLAEIVGADGIAARPDGRLTALPSTTAQVSEIVNRFGLFDGILIDTARMSDILEIDLRNRFLVAQAGAGRAALSAAVSADGCECAGILAAELVLPSGEIVVFGDKTEDVNGYDLLGFVSGAGGDAGIITEITVRLVRASQAEAILAALPAFKPFFKPFFDLSPETKKTLEAVRAVFQGA